jgi:dTDP-4-amino-4,6-dideoxygalactose transaminase
MIDHGIKYFGTAQEHSALMPRLLNEFERVILSGQSLQGPDVKDFEENIKNLVNRKYGVAVGSCTDALYFSLLAIGIKPNDEVVVPSFTFIASASCISRTGATPIFCDVDENGSASPASVKNLITEKTKAVVYVHMFGYYDWDNYKKVFDLCKTAGVFLIEDAAQAFGANYAREMAGGRGAVSCFSFDPTKVIAAPGSGGIILTDDENIHLHCRALRYHGKNYAGKFLELGFNSQMPSLTAAVLNLKLEYNDEWRTKRINIARMYIDQLSDLPLLLPPAPDGTKHIYHKFVIRLKMRDKLKDFLAQKNIQSLIHYETPLPEVPIFALSKLASHYENSLQLTREVLSLPCHPFLMEHEVSYICKCIREFFSLRPANTA